MGNLRSCVACARRVYVSETCCPFCCAKLEALAAPPTPVLRLAGRSRAQLFALATALMGQALTACGLDSGGGGMDGGRSGTGGAGSGGIDGGRSGTGGTFGGVGGVYGGNFAPPPIFDGGGWSGTGGTAGTTNTDAGDLDASASDAADKDIKR